MARRALFISLILFGTGFALATHTVETSIVNYVNRLFNLDLDIFFRSQGLFYCGCLLIIISFMSFLVFLQDKKFIVQKQVYGFSAASLIIFYFLLLWKNAINVPITDDYRMLIYVNEYIHATTLSEKWQILMDPINECRTPVVKVFYLAVFKIFGSINFRWVILFNGLILLGFCSVLLRSFHISNMYVIKLAFLFMLLQFQSFDLSFWATSGFTHYCLFLFVLISIKAIISRKRYGLIVASVFAVLASFTFGNGLLVFPIGCFLFLYQRRIQEAIFFFALMLAVCFVYFYSLTTLDSYLQLRPFAILVYALAFIGSSMQFLYKLYIPVLAGLFCLSVFIYATYKKYYRHNILTWAVLLFLLATAFTTGLFRLHWSPLQMRYGLYSIAAVIISIMILAEMFQTKLAVILRPRIILVLAICYSLLSGLMFYPEVPVRKAKLADFGKNWKTSAPKSNYFPVVPDDAKKHLEDAEREGIWHAEMQNSE